MAETEKSFLFAGTSFNRKKFSSIFEKFKPQKRNDDLEGEPTLVEAEKFGIQKEPLKTDMADRKRKRKKTDISILFIYLCHTSFCISYRH